MPKKQSKYPTKWNLRPLFIGDDDPALFDDQNDTEKAIDSFESKWKNRSDLYESPEILAEALEEYEELHRRYSVGGIQSYYLHLRRAQDQTNEYIKAKSSKHKDFALKNANKITFFSLNLGKIPKNKQEEMLNAQILDPYKGYLKEKFNLAKYDLTEKEENLDNLLSTTSISNWVKMTKEILSKEEVCGKPFHEAFELLSDQNPETRKKAADEFEEVFKKHQDIIEYEMNSVLEYYKTQRQIRGAKTPEEISLAGDNIEPEVVHAMLNAVENRYNVSRKYYKLKAKILGLEKLKYYERNLEYIPHGNRKEYSYDEACNIVSEVLYSLDEEFGDIFSMYRANGQIDVFPKKGKVGGAFCTHYTKETPTYILLNHTKELQSVTTIAHEVGHGINNELMKVQNELHFSTSLSTAEVASTFMEDFVLESLGRNLSEEEKTFISLRKMDDDMSSIFRQVAFYKFELELHKRYEKNGFISFSEIGKMFEKHMKAYLGSSTGAKSKNWWVYVGHFRRPFYVYSYASGLLISKALQNKVKQDPNFVEEVKRFLSFGTSKSPKEAFLELGIDISNPSFWDEGLQEIETNINNLEIQTK